MQTVIWSKASVKQKQKALARPAQQDSALLIKNVSSILYDVKSRGDVALRILSKKFDGTTRKEFKVSPVAVQDAVTKVDPKLIAAIKRAKANISIFHKAEYPKSIEIETMPGVTCALHWRPIERIGLYIPAGSAPLFSALLMQAVPAKIAGCDDIILCSPPQRDGHIHPAILATAHLCGIRNVFALGGAQAIASMAFGTQTVPKVDKIFGPGNAYVTCAKQMVSQDPQGAAIDMPAGPSEVMVIAEKSARADWVASDLLAQAEHDRTAQAILVTTDLAFGGLVYDEVIRQLAQLPRRTIATQSIAQSRILIVASMREAIKVANLYAPEHLIIHDEKAEKFLPLIRNAGSVFLGSLTPESAGDYASGTNHVLPTYGYARAYSGLTVQSFMKSMTAQKITKQGLQKLGPTIMTMAEAEGLEAHANAVRIRMENQK